MLRPAFRAVPLVIHVGKQKLVGRAATVGLKLLHAWILFMEELLLLFVFLDDLFIFVCSALVALQGHLHFVSGASSGKSRRPVAAADSNRSENEESNAEHHHADARNLFGNELQIPRDGFLVGWLHTAGEVNVRTPLNHFRFIYEQD